MSGYNYPDDDSYDEGHSGGGGLRRQLEEALGEIRTLRKQLTGDRREQTVTELLQGKGLDPAVKDLIPEDADPVQWVEKYSYLLGAKGAASPTDVPAPAPELEMATDDDPALVAERDALASIRDAAESGSTATVSNDLIEQMNKFNSEEELISFFKKNGMA